MAPGGTNNKNNVLPLWGNEKTMNLNNLILTNIQSSHYFKVNLFELKTYHEVIDEIYYKVAHLEPWEKGSRKTAGQTGMCGGVRGVGAGGIVSTAFCLLYKLFTLKLTRKQVNGLITHCDSPYIRSLGFMYVRYTQPPSDLWDWYEAYLDDEEEVDVKAGGGCVMTIGEMLRHFLTKLEWYSTLFPRIPVPIQKDLERKLLQRGPMIKGSSRKDGPSGPGGGGGGGSGQGGFRDSDSPNQRSSADYKERHIPDEEVSWGEAERISRLRRSASRERKPKEETGSERRNDDRRDHSDYDRGSRRGHDKDREDGERRRDHHHHHRDRNRSKHHSRSRSRDRKHRDHEKNSKEGNRSRHRQQSRSRSEERYYEK